LHCITTYWNVVKYFLKKTENNLAMAKKTSATAGLGHLFTQKMLSRVRRKRLNTAAGFACCRCKNGLNFTHHNLQLLVLSSLHREI
jgi:hypothetical protein